MELFPWFKIETNVTYLGLVIFINTIIISIYIIFTIRIIL